MLISVAEKTFTFTAILTFTTVARQREANNFPQGGVNRGKMMKIVSLFK